MMQSRRIDPLLRRAQDHEDEAARDLAQQQQALDTHLSRLKELRQYAEEYSQIQMDATTPAALSNRRAFLDRLDSAVQQQSLTVDHNRTKLEAERARLLLASREKQVLEQLADSYRLQERLLVNRREQHEMDDLGARRNRQLSEPDTDADESP
jgi:flagellar FliJ protein